MRITELKLPVKNLWYNISIYVDKDYKTIEIEQFPSGPPLILKRYVILKADNGNNYKLYLSGENGEITYNITGPIKDEAPVDLYLKANNGKYYPVFLNFITNKQIILSVGEGVSFWKHLTLKVEQIKNSF